MVAYSIWWKDIMLQVPTSFVPNTMLILKNTLGQIIKYI